MSRTLWAAASALAIFVSASAASAGNPLANFWYSFKRDWHRNNAWPEPFPAPARAAVQAPFCQMVANGWRRQNLLSDHHFLGDGSRLSPAGRHKMWWILTQTPPQFRTVYVSLAKTPWATDVRVDAVQQYAAQILPNGQLPDVQKTHIVEEGTPASVVDTVFTRYQESARPPVLVPSDLDVEQ